MQPFVFHRPRTLAEAATLLGTHPGAQLVAGGTDLVPNLRRGLAKPTDLIDLSCIEGFGTIGFDAHAVVLGAGLRLAQLAAEPLIARYLRAVADAAASVAAPPHRSAATLGGNLCLDTRCVFYNQSDWWRAANAYCLKKGGTTCHVAPQGARCHAAFSGDLAPALLIFDAQIELVAAHATRRIALADLYRDDGADALTRAHGEVLSKVHVARAPAGQVSAYRKARVRGSIDFPLAGVALALSVQDGALSHLRVALTGTNSRPLVLEGTDALLGQPVTDGALTTLGKLVQKQVSPMRTTVTASNHRRLVASALAQRLLRELADEASKSGRPS